MDTTKINKLNYLKAVLLSFLTVFTLKGETWTDCSREFESIEILAQTVTVPSPAEIDYKAGLGKEFREALGGRTDIDWKAVQDHYREWSEHTTTLSGPARMLVACVLSVVTQGMGTSEWLAGHGIAEGTATNAALSSGIQTLAASAGTALASNLGDFSKAFDELTSAAALKNLTASILSAGLQLDTAASLPEATLKSAESLAIQTGLQNRKLGDILISDVVDAGSAQLAHTIGDAKATGLNKTIGQLAHAGAGALKEQLKGGDPLAGAIGAVVAETAAEIMDKPSATPADRQAIANKARIVGDTIAFLAGRNVASADSSGKTAVENNFIAHPEASMKIAMAVRDESLSEEERSQKIEEALDYAKTENKVYMTTAAATLAPTITAGYFATQSAAHWAGTYAGGGIEAVKQEFKDHPIASTLDVATTGMLGAGFVKGMTRTGLQVMSKQPATRVYQPKPEQSALSLQRGFTGNKGSNIKANYEIDRRIPRYDRNTEHIVNGRRYGAHAMDQMQNRGIPPSVVENTITTGQKIPAKDGRLQYYEKVNNITVIAEPNGDIVTVRYGEK